MNSGMHAVIMVGKDPDYKRQRARKLAEETAAGYRENIYWIESDGKSVKDKAIEELLERLSYKPLIGDMKVAVIDDADTITERAQNRLLKTLEEPSGKVLIILLSSNEENLLDTVRSRCAIFKLQQQEKEGEVSPANKKFARDLIDKKPYYNFVGVVKEIGPDRAEGIRFLDEIKRGIKDILFEKGEFERAHNLIKIIEESEKDMKQHMMQGFALKNTILKILEENS